MVAVWVVWFRLILVWFGPLTASGSLSSDTTKRLMSSPKCRSVEVINNPARSGSNHMKVNCINNNNNNNNNKLKRVLRCDIDVRIKQG